MLRRLRDRRGWEWCVTETIVGIGGDEVMAWVPTPLSWFLTRKTKKGVPALQASREKELRRPHGVLVQLAGDWGARGPQ